MNAPTDPPTPLGSRDVLGVPVLPPAGATRLMNLVRSWLARVHRALAPPPVRVMDAALAGLETAVVAALCHLGIPDRLERPTPIGQLAATLTIDPDRLERLLRHAHVRGWVRLDRRGRVRPTRLTAFLRSDHPGGWGAWPTFAASPQVAAALSALGEGLHDWDDGAAAQLLARAADAARTTSAGGADPLVIVVDSCAQARPVDNITLLADTLMLALTPGGHERSVEGFTTIGHRAGLELRRQHALASGDMALVFGLQRRSDRTGNGPGS